MEWPGTVETVPEQSRARILAFGFRACLIEPARSRFTGNAMSPEPIAIIIATATLGALTLTTTARLGQRIDRVDLDVADLRERMARLEGLFEGFTRRESTAPGTGTA